MFYKIRQAFLILNFITKFEFKALVEIVLLKAQRGHWLNIEIDIEESELYG
jgi:hypothetical protein